MFFGPNPSNVPNLQYAGVCDIVCNVCGEGKSLVLLHIIRQLRTKKPADGDVQFNAFGTQTCQEHQGTLIPTSQHNLRVRVGVHLLLHGGAGSRMEPLSLLPAHSHSAQPGARRHSLGFRAQS